MTLKAKLKELTDQKPKGKEWYCYQVPDEYHVWGALNKWKKNLGEEYGVSPLRIKVRGTASENVRDVVSYTRHKPLKLKCGVEVTGKEITSQVRTFIYDLRVDGTKEINDALTEMSIGPGYSISSFDIHQLEVYHKKNGVMILADRHNPDGSGVFLYIVALRIDKELKLYPNVDLGDMARYLGEFKGNLAECENIAGLQKACVIKQKSKRTQVKRRRKVKGSGTS